MPRSGDAAPSAPTFPAGATIRGGAVPNDNGDATGMTGAGSSKTDRCPGERTIESERRRTKTSNCEGDQSVGTRKRSATERRGPEWRATAARTGIWRRHHRDFGQRLWISCETRSATLSRRRRIFSSRRKLSGAFGLRDGMWIHGETRRGNRGPQLTRLLKINDEEPTKYQGPAAV